MRSRLWLSQRIWDSYDVPRSNFLPSLSMAFIVNMSSNTTFEALVVIVPVCAAK